MLTVSQFPEPIVFSKNPVNIQIRSDYVGTSASYKIFLNIFDADDNLIGVEYRNVDSIFIESIDGDSYFYALADFDVSEYLKKYPIENILYLELMSLGMQDTGKVNSFSFTAYEVFSDVAVNTINVGSLKAVHGGFSNLFRQSYSKTIAEFFNNFLTWQPEKHIAPTEIDFLYFLLPVANDSPYAKFKIYLDNGDIVYHSVKVTLEADKLYRLNVSHFANNLEYFEVQNLIVKYDVWITNDLSETLVSPRTFYVDRNTYYNNKQIFFRNSLGGYDFMTFKGQHEVSKDTEKTSGFYENESIQISAKEQKNTTVNTNWLSLTFANNDKAKSYMTEILKSTDVKELVNGLAIPIVMNSSKLKLSDSNEFLFAFDIDYYDAKLNKSYSK